MELDDESKSKIDAMANAIRALRNDLHFKTWDAWVGGISSSGRDGIQSHDCWIDSIHNNSTTNITIGLGDNGTKDKILVTIAPGATQPFYGMPFHHGVAVTTFAPAQAGTNATVVIHGRIKA